MTNEEWRVRARMLQRGLDAAQEITGRLRAELRAAERVIEVARAIEYAGSDVDCAWGHGFDCTCDHAQLRAAQLKAALQAYDAAHLHETEDGS